jgi:hypothetical protein
MERCQHGMDTAWCYQCRVEAAGEDARAVWGLETAEHEDDLELSGPMTPHQRAELRFLCAEFGEAFDGSLTEGEAAVVTGTFLDEPMSEPQRASLAWLSERAGAEAPDALTYGQARSVIRRLIALRGLRSA